MPLVTISGAGRIPSCEAGMTLAGRIFAAERSLPSSFARPDSRGRLSPHGASPHGACWSSGSDSASKIKGRPKAAEVDITADIKSSNISGNAAVQAAEAGALFAFYSPRRILLRSLDFVKGLVL